MTPLKQALIKEIEDAPDERIENFLQLWRQTQPETLVDFLRNSPLAEALQEEEITIDRDKSIYGDRAPSLQSF